jgi:hypothetical protein
MCDKSDIYQKKYLKYKEKYFNIKNNLNMIGGNQAQIETINKYFKGAITNSNLMKTIGAKKLDPNKTHFTLSICCDEINHEKGDLPDLCRNHFGEVFQMGGLGGIPFPGITGLGATLHHVPTDGTLFILYGPHVGISTEGKVGDYNRFGIEHAGHACGAAIGAYTTIKNNKTITSNVYDSQFQYIVNKLKDKMNTITDLKDENQTNVNIANAMYDIIQEWIEEFKVEFKKQKDIKKLILLGGIVINTSSNTTNKIQDYFLIKNPFEIVEIK